MKHHPTASPSKLNYLRQCRAFESEPFVKSPAAESGDRCHTAWETGDDSELNPDELSVVQKVRNLWSPVEQDGEVHTELEVQVELNNGYSTFGHLDRLVVKGAEAWLCDLKTGFVAVPDAEENLQGLCYAVGVFQKFTEIETIQVWFIMPRRDETTSTILVREELPQYITKLTQLIAEASQPDPPRTPSACCTYCSQRGTCPVLANAALEITRKIDRLAIPETGDLTKVTARDLDTVILPAIRILTAWATAAKRHAVELARAGHPFEHHRLCQRGQKTFYLSRR